MEEIVRLTSRAGCRFPRSGLQSGQKPHHFEKILPRLAMPDAMTHHFALKHSGRIRAMLAFIRSRRP